MRHFTPASLEFDGSVLVYRTPYDAVLVQALKQAIPASDRKWDGKAWQVMPQHAQTLVQLTSQYLGQALPAPKVSAPTAAAETRILDVRYIGACKDRGDGTRTAFGWSNGSWSVIFPESALRTWFNAEARPGEATTLYAVLGLPTTAAHNEVKTAYRRLSLQWHPDRCKEPGAAEEFIKIKHAYDVLSDPNTQARYDAGLALATAVRQSPGYLALQTAPDGYRSPLRCGYIMASGWERLGRFVVENILGWQDITSSRGVLVTSWPMGAEQPMEDWQ